MSGVTADDLVARAAAMREVLRARQSQCEAQGRLPDETNREYIEAGFFRVLQPRRFGGHELGLAAFLRIAIELSRGCPSSGWVYALTAGHAHTVTMWPEQGQVELFGDGDFRCPFSNLPARAVPVDGGYRIGGWWDYGSGCDTATHFIGGVAVVAADGGPPADTRWAAFPRSAYEIVDNWDTLGMRGTGSAARRGRGSLRPRPPHGGLAEPWAPARRLPRPRRARQPDLSCWGDHAPAGIGAGRGGGRDRSGRD